MELWLSAAVVLLCYAALLFGLWQAARDIVALMEGGE